MEFLYWVFFAILKVVSSLSNDSARNESTGAFSDIIKSNINNNSPIKNLPPNVEESPQNVNKMKTLFATREERVGVPLELLRHNDSPVVSRSNAPLVSGVIRRDDESKSPIIIYETKDVHRSPYIIGTNEENISPLHFPSFGLKLPILNSQNNPSQFNKNINNNGNHNSQNTQTFPGTTFSQNNPPLHTSESHNVQQNQRVPFFLGGPEYNFEDVRPINPFTGSVSLFFGLEHDDVDDLVDLDHSGTPEHRSFEHSNVNTGLRRPGSFGIPLPENVAPSLPQSTHSFNFDTNSDSYLPSITRNSKESREEPYDNSFELLKPLNRNVDGLSVHNNFHTNVDEPSRNTANRDSVLVPLINNSPFPGHGNGQSNLGDKAGFHLPSINPIFTESREDSYDDSSELVKPLRSPLGNGNINDNTQFFDSALTSYEERHSLVKETPRQQEANYSFGYRVSNSDELSHSHRETRKGNRVEGSYHVDLPNGIRQIVKYYADATGYHPTITYEPIPTLSTMYAKMIVSGNPHRTSNGTGDAMIPLPVPYVHSNPNSQNSSHKYIQFPTYDRFNTTLNKNYPVFPTAKKSTTTATPYSVSSESDTTSNESSYIGSLSNDTLTGAVNLSYAPPSFQIDPKYIRKSSKPLDANSTVNIDGTGASS